MLAVIAATAATMPASQVGLLYRLAGNQPVTVLGVRVTLLPEKPFETDYQDLYGADAITEPGPNAKLTEDGATMLKIACAIVAIAASK